MKKNLSFLCILLLVSILQVVFLGTGLAADTNECTNCMDDPLTIVPPNNLKANAFRRSATSSSSETLIFRTDTASELDQYDCGSAITFDINISGVNLSAVQKATLSMAVYDVDYSCPYSSCERDTVSINGHLLNTPLAYLTGANNQWSNVSFDVPTSYLQDGANTILVQIDTLSGGWCVEVDYGQLTIEQKGGPELIGILLDGNASKSQFIVPYTGKDYTVTFNVENTDGYTLQDVTGTVDNSFNPGKKTVLKKKASGDYFLHFDTTNRGTDTLSCQLTYVNDTSGATYVVKGEKTFSLFFERDFVPAVSSASDRKPLWFTYWKEDEAVAGFDDNVEYDATKSGYGYATTASSSVFLCARASGQHYSRAITVTTSSGSESFGGPTVKGIDTASEVIAHERYHLWVTAQWKTGGTFVGKTDSDKSADGTKNDRLPDFYETATSKTSNTSTDTYDLEHLKHSSYSRYGDEEYMAMKTGDGGRGTQSKDWAAPGKQYTGTTSSRFAVVKSNTVSATRTDTNSNGFYDVLAITVAVEIPADDEYNFMGMLSTENGDEIASSSLVTESLDTGTQYVTFSFDGKAINLSAKNGPYVLSYNYTDGLGEEEVEVDKALTTSAWSYTSFEGQQIGTNGVYSAEAVDNTSDGKKDVLNLTVQLNVGTPGTYTVGATLIDSTGAAIGYEETTTSLAAGSAIPVVISFPKDDIVTMRAEAPWTVSALSIKDEDDNVVAYVEPGFEISGLTWTDFTSTSFIGSGLTDSGEDTNNNTQYDYLNISVPVEVSQAGTYTLTGKLFDSKGNSIEAASATATLSTGSQTMVIQFKGSLIFLNEVDGPYRLSYVVAYDDIGNIVDSMAKDYYTQSYDYTAFEGPSVTLLNNYSEQAVDSDDDGTYESLDISFDFYVTYAGTYSANARLIDANGEEIVWSSDQVYLAADSIGTVILSFSGTALYQSGPGPYTMIDLYVYNNSNTTYAASSLVAYATTASFVNSPSNMLAPIMLLLN